MEIIRNILLILHIVGFAGVAGSAIAQLPKVKEGAAKISGGILHSSWLMLATGLGLVGMMYAGDGDGPNNAKIGVKTLVLVAIIVLALVNKKKQPVSGGVLGAILGLSVLNVALAVAW